MTTPGQLTADVPSLPAESTKQSPMSKEVLRQARRAASAVKQFAKRNPSQILCLHESKKLYPRIEAWQLLAACFGCNALITATQELRDDAGTEIGFLAIAHVKNPSNQFVSGAEAVCMRAEEEWAHKPAFQLRSMAQTRAEGKAFRLQFGWVMVMAGFEATPAEEIEFGKAFDQIESAAEPIRATPKLVTERQVNAFQEACAINGKTLEDARNYLQSQFGVDDVTRLKRGKQCTEALRWAQTPNQNRRPTQPALTLLDSIPAHKDAWSL